MSLTSCRGSFLPWRPRRTFTVAAGFLLMVLLLYVARSTHRTMTERQGKDYRSLTSVPGLGSMLDSPTPQLLPLPLQKELSMAYFRLNDSLANISLVHKDKLLKGDKSIASISSPVLHTDDLVNTVKNMYATSKKLKTLYQTPKLKQDKFTVIMLSYNRTDNLYEIFRHYCSMTTIIDKFLLIWNNVGVPVPTDLLVVPCSFPIVFITPKQNTLNNRFLPYSDIETECVFSLDDDHLISEKGLQFGFNVWKSFPHLLVGFVPRSHGWKDGQYYYQKEPVRHGEVYSIVLTVAMFMNYKYMGLYTYDSPKEILEFVKEHKNGEDISMVAVVANYLKQIDKSQCACLWVREGMKDLDKEKKKKTGLHHKQKHFEERNDCVNLLNRLYGGLLPIQYCTLEVRRTQK